MTEIHIAASVNCRSLFPPPPPPVSVRWDGGTGAEAQRNEYLFYSFSPLHWERLVESYKHLQVFPPKSSALLLVCLDASAAVKQKLHKGSQSSLYGTGGHEQ